MTLAQRPPYCWVEDVAGATDIAETARARARILRQIQQGADSVDGLCRRVFYPEHDTRYIDWPALSPGAPSWVLRLLGRNELVSLTSLTAGGVTISASDVNLEPNQDGPPYRRLEIQLDSGAALSTAGTYQRSVAVAGVFGYRSDWSGAGTISGAVADATSTSITVSNSAAVGIGALIAIDDEWMMISAKSMTTTGQSLQASLTAAKTDVSVSVTTGSAYNVDEIIFIDAERMRIVEIVGNTLVVERAVDGSYLSTHTTGTIYARRACTVERGVLGTTAAAHSSGAAVSVFEPPPLVRELATAEAVVGLAQGQAGWARTVGTGDNQREARGAGLKDLRDRCFDQHGVRVLHAAV